MKSYDVLGYALDGYVVCSDCSTEEDDKNGDAIFADSEWDSYPTCDRCLQEIEDIQLTTDGIEWLHGTGRKADWESFSDIFPEQARTFYYAYLATDNKWYCLDYFCSEVLEGKQELVQQFREQMINDHITDNEYLLDIISENTGQYEQWLGQSIPLEGIYCHSCGSELYAPYEVEQAEESE